MWKNLTVLVASVILAVGVGALGSSTPKFDSVETPALTATSIPLRIVPTSTPSPSPTLAAGDIYTDPDYGWTVNWDPAIWSARVDPINDNSLRLSSPSLKTEVTIQTGDRDSEPELVIHPSTCLELADTDAQDLDYQQQYGVDDQPLRGMDEDRAWGVFSRRFGINNPPAFSYIECRTVVSDEAIFFMEAVGPLDQFNAVAPEIERITASIHVPR